MSLKLYGADVCPFVHRVRLVLAEKDLEHEYVAIDLRNKPEWYHDVLPTGKVPLLEDGDHRIWESGILCEFLEDAYPEPALLPQAPAARADARMWINFSSERFVPVFYKLLMAQESDEQNKHKEALEKVLEDLEKRLHSQEGTFLCGELSLADLELYPWFERFCVLEHYRGVSLPPHAKAIATWLESMRALKSVQDLEIEDGYFIDQYSHYANGTLKPV